MNRKLLAAITTYIFALIAANLLVAAFGPTVTPINAFLLIGLDLALRDALHFQLKNWQMATLILAASVSSYLLNPASGQIAIASAIAFLLSNAIDWIVFSRTKGNWLKRSNISNASGALIDSLIFPLIAFGSILPAIIAGQFLAKVAGGAIWSMVLARVLARTGTT